MVCIENILTTGQIASACGGILRNLSGDEVVKNVVIDSRMVQSGSVFVAIKGDRVDGHDFCTACNSLCCIVSRENIKGPVILVDNTMKALREVAFAYRKKFTLPIVAVTGSVGKTTCKDMIADVLSLKFNTLKNKGNFNNLIGLPLTLFELNYEHKIAVVEMGMSDLGEISLLSNITLPDTAVITNIGVAHIQNLKSQKNIFTAKLEIVEGISANGTLILNGDDEMLNCIKDIPNLKILRFGLKNKECDIIAFDVSNSPNGCDFKVQFQDRTYQAHLNIPGRHNVYNILAACLVGLNYGIKIADSLQKLSTFIPDAMRQNIIKTPLYTVIEDCYNASTESVIASLEVLMSLSREKQMRTVAVLGDMLELGEYSKLEHCKVGRAVFDAGVDVLITIGGYSEYIAQEAQDRGMKSVYKMVDKPELIAKIFTIIKKDDIILFKASRGINLEKVSQIVIDYENMGLEI